MGEVLDIGALRQVVQLYDGRQEMLANGDRELAEQEAHKAENALILQAQAEQIAAYRQHLEELDGRLALRRGEVIEAEKDEDLLARLSGETRYALMITLEQVVANLRGQVNVRDDLLSIGLVRKWLRQHTAVLEGVLGRIRPRPMGGARR